MSWEEEFVCGGSITYAGSHGEESDYFSKCRVSITYDDDEAPTYRDMFARACRAFLEHMWIVSGKPSEITRVSIHLARTPYFGRGDA
jgi:hypothetical protein